jgi:hypothetical protein
MAVPHVTKTRPLQWRRGDRLARREHQAKPAAQSRRRIWRAACCRLPRPLLVHVVDHHGRWATVSHVAPGRMNASEESPEQSRLIEAAKEADELPDE